MRIDRTFVFAGRIDAFVEPVTLFDSSLERVCVMSGKLWYVRPGGSRVTIDDETNDIEPSVVAANTRNGGGDEDDDDEAQAGGMTVSPTSSSLVVRDLQGRIPYAHAGQYVVLSLVRRGIYEVADRRARECVDTSEAVLLAADFRRHIYDVLHCKSTKIAGELTLSVLTKALDNNDPLGQIEQQRRVASDGDNRVRLTGRGSGSKGRPARSSLVGKLSATIQMCRSQMTTLGGLLAALDGTVDSTRCIIAFTGYYRAHAYGAYSARSDIAPLLASRFLDESLLQRCSPAELELLVDWNQHRDSHELLLAERLFFGALIDRVPLAEYEQALGRWRGLYYSTQISMPTGPGAVPTAETKAAYATWHQQVGTVLGVTNAGVRRDVGFVAWALYNTSQTLLAYQAGATVFLLPDVLESCARYYAADERFNLQKSDCVKQARALLLRLDVWRVAPVEFDAPHRRTTGTYTAADNAPRAYMQARTFDVSVRLSHLLIGAGALFVAQNVYCDNSDALPAHSLLLYYNGLVPTAWKSSPDVATLQCISLALTFECDREDLGAACELHMAVQSARTVVVVHAHTLSEVQLLRLLLMFGIHDGSLRPGAQRFVFVGDDRMASPFASLCRVYGTRTPADLQPLTRIRNEPESTASRLQLLTLQALQDRSGQAEARNLIDELLRTLAHESAAQDRSLLLPRSMRSPVHRFVLVAHTHAGASAALAHLAHVVRASRPVPPERTVDADGNVAWPVLWQNSAADRAYTDCDALERQLLLLADNPRQLESTLLLAAPFVGYRGRCVLVQRLFAISQHRAELDRSIRESDCVELTRSTARQAVSLDSFSLLLELPFDDTHDAEDHRICCGTWASNIVSVAMHRSCMCSQSLPMADSALPCDNHLSLAADASTVLVLSPNYTAQAFYAAVVRSSCRPKPFAVIATHDAMDVRQAIDKHQGAPTTCLYDVYSSLRHKR